MNNQPLPNTTNTLDITRRWRTDQRYYVAELTQDLFGVWLVKRSWGGLNNHRGSSKTTVAESYDHAQKLLADITKRRHTRQYALVA